MKYDTKHLPDTLADLNGFRLSEWEDDVDGTAGTYNESEFDDYRVKVISIANDLSPEKFTTETDDTGVYLTPEEEY